MADVIRIEFTRFSAFYSPLIATMAGGFLKAEGLEGKHSVSAPGTSAIAGLIDGSLHVAQSAPSYSFGPLEKGTVPPIRHFAQINEKDGFFLAGRAPDAAFTWDKLKGRKVIPLHRTLHSGAACCRRRLTARYCHHRCCPCTLHVDGCGTCCS